jgi:hypothetical protein
MLVNFSRHRRAPWVKRAGWDSRSGGGGIRTHEGFHPAGFQVRRATSRAIRVHAFECASDRNWSLRPPFESPLAPARPRVLMGNRMGRLTLAPSGPRSRAPCPRPRARVVTAVASRGADPPCGGMGRSNAARVPRSTRVRRLGVACVSLRPSKTRRSAPRFLAHLGLPTEGSVVMLARLPHEPDRSTSTDALTPTAAWRPSQRPRRAGCAS